MAQAETKRAITIHLELPASVPIGEREAREILILKLVEEGFLSQSEGAQLLGVSRAELIERMTQARMGVVRYTAEDLARESAVLEWIRHQRAVSGSTDE